MNKKNESMNEEMNDAQMTRQDVIENATYAMLATIAGFDPTDSEILNKFPWNIGMIRSVLDDAIDTLRENELQVCDPYIEEDVNCRNLVSPDCNCSKCQCRDMN